MCLAHRRQSLFTADDPMKNIVCILEYDGSSFHGWQAQKGLRTVEGEFVKALKRSLQVEPKVLAAGRTDVGVHALGQVVNFSIDTPIPADKIFHQINTKLPEDLKVRKSYEASPNFHARFSATSKEYLYKVYCSNHMHPVFRNYAEHITYSLDRSRIKKAASYFVGRHDFSAFFKDTEQGVNPVRTIDRFDIHESGDFLEFHIKGHSFLRNQVRAMVGTLLSVGRGAKEPEEVGTLLLEKDRKNAGKTVSGKGLYLVKINYEEE